MGMYTYFELNAVVRLSEYEQNVLDHYMSIYPQLATIALPNYSFFSAKRANQLFGEASTMTDLGDRLFNLTIDSTFKNYDDEIQKFLDWISPFALDTPIGEVAGWYRYEECEFPTLFAFNKQELIVYEALNEPRY